ncbi:hypothetical protein MA16_Dca016831 [Dendrobium catenatum]|uniref:Uncharacterized protein n=1 Tax=Dendrobium catenatum TaxID=906689 RepID=A0A2I0VYJ7_9ASPA|nr:hypothetical protein MA16_Dca016831 [Dendrobium catenatum]
MAATQRKKIPRFLWWFEGLRGSKHRVVAPWHLDNNPFRSRTFGQHIENLGQQFVVFQSAGQQDILAGISGQQAEFQECSSFDTGQDLDSNQTIGAANLDVWKALDSRSSSFRSWTATHFRGKQKFG